MAKDKQTQDRWGAAKHPMKDRLFIASVRDDKSNDPDFGRVEGMVGSDHAMVTMFESRKSALIPIARMEGWHFYATSEDFMKALARGIFAPKTGENGRFDLEEVERTHQRLHAISQWASQ